MCRCLDVRLYICICVYCTYIVYSLSCLYIHRDIVIPGRNRGWLQPLVLCLYSEQRQYFVSHKCFLLQNKQNYHWKQAKKTDNNKNKDDDIDDNNRSGVSLAIRKSGGLQCIERSQQLVWIYICLHNFLKAPAWLDVWSLFGLLVFASRNKLLSSVCTLVL